VINNVYRYLLSEALKIGVPRCSRGLKHRELWPAPTVVKLPAGKSGLITLAARRLNYAFHVVEKLSYLSGAGFYPRVICHYNKNYGNFISQIKTDPSAYGPRISQQLQHVYNLLRDDPHTRQAVISVYGFRDDMLTSTTSVPCTLNLHFMMSPAHQLDLIVYMRSNDLMWGFPYDVAAFKFLQDVMARWLSVKSGAYTHVATSMHLYENMVDKARVVIADDRITKLDPPQWDLFFEHTFDELLMFWEIEERVRLKVDTTELEQKLSSGHLQWCVEIIKDYWRRKHERSR